MAVKFNHQQVLDTFKKKISFLKAKEKQHHEQLNAALSGARQVGHKFKSEIKSKLRQLDTKIDAAQAAKYVKTFIELERQMMRDVAKKAKAFARALSQIDKQNIKSTKPVKAKKATRKKSIKK